MKIKFHGVRGSHPVAPTPARIQEIIRSVWEYGTSRKIKSWNELEAALSKEIARSKYQVYGGNTTCLELKSDKLSMPLFFDAGSGFTAASMDPQSGLNNAEFRKGKGKAAIFLSHTHWDHIMGLITAEQIFGSGNEFHFYGVHKKLSERIEHLFVEDHFPVPFRYFDDTFKFHQIPLNTSVTLGELTIDHCPQSHPGASFAYRVSDGKKVFVFATDTELKNVDPPHMVPGQTNYSDADVLVLDAQFSPEDIRGKEGYGHSEIHGSVDFAVRERVKRLYLFHQSPTYSDALIDEQVVRAREYFSQKYGTSAKLEIHMAIEGHEITV